LRRFQIFLAALMMTALAGCGADSGNPRQTNGDATDTTTTNPDVTGDFTGDQDVITGCPGVDDPGGDADGDGLINGIEDRNANCVFEPLLGETDPADEDTDDDRIKDGDEDINGNGIYEPEKGEFDPNNSDSNGNGVPDGQEPGALICTGDLLDAIVATPAQFSGSNMAMPKGYTINQHQAAAAATFTNNADGSFGFIVKTDATSSNAEQENSQSLVKVAQAGNLPTVTFSKLFKTPEDPPLWDKLQFIPQDLRVTGVRAQIVFSYGAGSPNASSATKDPATLRDQIVSAISGQAVTTGESAAACDRIRVYWIAQLRGDNSLITSGILTCATNFDANEALQFAYEDLLSGTIVAPGNYNPVDFKCEDMIPQSEAGKVDFLWVIDNSGSMADEQNNVAVTAQKFMQTLAASEVDWRLGVTTTESYGIAGGLPLGTPLDHDELLDQATGLRGVGFLTPTDVDATALFTQYVTFDQGCLKTDSNGTPIAPEDSNVCGFGWEEGLESGAVVLERTLIETRASHKLRADSKRIVIWVSDEEVQAVKLDNKIDSIGSSDPRWPGIIGGYISRYKALSAIGFAIVGDVGNEFGGVCQGLPATGSAIVGAQYGQSYVEVANATEGAVGIICNDDLQDTIDAIIRVAIAMASEYQLVGYPISSSIRVAVDGHVIPRSHTSGWNYDVTTNSIVFFGVNITLESRISVAYLMWVRQDG